MGDDNATIKAMRAELRLLQRENRRLRHVWVFDQLSALGIDPTSQTSMAVIEGYRFPLDSDDRIDMSLVSLKRYLVEQAGTSL